MGRHGFLAKANPLAQHDTADKTRKACVDVNHRAARKVQRPPVPQQSVCRQICAGSLGCNGIARSFGNQFQGLLFRQEIRATPPPNHMCHRKVDERDPQHDKDHQAGEFHPFGKGADDQGGGNHCKGHLECNEGEFGQPDTIGKGRHHRCDVNAAQKRLVKTADIAVPRPARRKRQRIAVGDPDDRHHRRYRKDLG